MTGGFGFVTAFQALDNATSLKNGPFIAPIFYVLGGPRQFSQGHDQLVVEESRSFRVSVPIFVRYESIDFENSLESQNQTGSHQVFSGATINTELGFKYEQDILSDWGMGAGIGYRMFGIPMSKVKVTDSYLTMYLSLKRYLD